MVTICMVDDVRLEQKEPVVTNCAKTRLIQMCLMQHNSDKSDGSRPDNGRHTMLKPNQVRIRLYADDEAVVKRISEHTRLSSTDVVSMILHAALRSIEKNNGQFSLPLRFTLSDEIPEPISKGEGISSRNGGAVLRNKTKKPNHGNK